MGNKVALGAKLHAAVDAMVAGWPADRKVMRRQVWAWLWAKHPLVLAAYLAALSAAPPRHRMACLNSLVDHPGIYRPRSRRD
jgi:hypothetical protein